MSELVFGEFLRHGLICGVIAISLKCSVLILLAAVCDRILHNRMPLLRRRIWVGLIIGCSVVPILSASAFVITLPIKSSRLAALQNSSTQPRDGMPIDMIVMRPEEEKAALKTGPAFENNPSKETGDANAAISVSNSFPGIPILTTVWLVVFLGLAIRLSTGIGRCFWIVENSVAPSILMQNQIRRLLPFTDVTVAISDKIVMPFTAGFIRPVIVLPFGSCKWSKERLQAVINHESGHVARRDNVFQLLISFLVAVNWFNPLFWYANRRWTICCEFACDQDVVSRSMPGTSYGQELIGLARDLKNIKGRPIFGSSFLGRSQLETRINFILSDTPCRNGTIVANCLLIFLIGSSVVLGPTVVAAVKGPSEINESLGEDNHPAMSAKLHRQVEISGTLNRLHVETDVGNIVVRQSGGKHIEIIAHVSVEHTSTGIDELSAKFEDHVAIEVDDGRMLVRSEHLDSKDGLQNPWRVGFTVLVPEKLRLSTRVSKGDVDVAESVISLEVSIDEGDFRFSSESVAESLSAKLRKGNLNIDLENGATLGADLMTSNGVVHLQGSSELCGKFQTACGFGKVMLDGNDITRANGAGTVSTKILGTGGPTYRLMAAMGGIQVDRK